MYDEDDLIDSPLSNTFTANGFTVEIQIYRLPDAGWTLEVVDQHDNSTVWEVEFATDQEALDTVLTAIRSDGIESFIGRPPKEPLH